MQIPITSGIYTDDNADFRTSYPVNYVVIPKANGISDSYLRPWFGIKQFCTVPGIDKGGINWNGVMYRVVGTALVRIDQYGAVTTLGYVANDYKVTMDYGFDQLSISSGLNLYYLTGTTLTQVTDPDLGSVIDHIWIDGYFMCTDGEFIVVTELNAPTSVLPLKYASSESDPDPIVALLKIMGEACAVNRYTCQFFNNVGGSGFPFQRNDGAVMQKGAVGTHACCNFMDTFAFVGSGRNESIGIYLAGNSIAQKISTREIDTILADYTEAELSVCILEAMVDKSNQYLIFHLPDRSLVFDAAASQEIQAPAWSIVTSALLGFSAYRGRNLVYCYNKWFCGDNTDANIGTIESNISAHFGQAVRWEFATQITYNNGNGAIFHELELVALPGRVPPVYNSVTSAYPLYSQTGGMTFSDYMASYTGGSAAYAQTAEGSFTFTSTRIGVYFTVPTMSDSVNLYIAFTDSALTDALGLSLLKTAGAYTYQIGNISKADLSGSASLTGYSAGDVLCIAVEKVGTVGKVHLYKKTSYSAPFASFTLSSALTSTLDRFTIYATSAAGNISEVDIVETPTQLFTGVTQLSRTVTTTEYIEPYISTCYSLDGESWSNPKSISAGNRGNRLKRLTWLSQGSMRNWRIQKFSGDSSSHLAFARLEARIEALNYG